MQWIANLFVAYYMSKSLDPLCIVMHYKLVKTSRQTEWRCIECIKGGLSNAIFKFFVNMWIVCVLRPVDLIDCKYGSQWEAAIIWRVGATGPDSGSGYVFNKSIECESQDLPWFFIIDGCSFNYAHTWSKSGFSICSRHLVTSKESLNSIFFRKRPC